MPWLGTLAGHGAALLAYVLLFAVVVFPFWGRGEVIAPDRQEAALGLADTADAEHPENPLFGDYPKVYVPEVSALRHAPRSGWLATWDPYNELGRPLYHDAGFSPAYLPTRVLFALADDPHRIITWLSLLTAFAGGLFAFGLARESGLAPIACLVAAAFLGLGPPVLFWLAFPMFHAVLAWSCGCLYALARLRRAPSLGNWCGLSFCVYSLLMTGYQQDVVLHAYLLAGCGLVATWQAWRAGGARAATKLVGLAGSAVASGLVAALPVYVDLWVRAQESARLAVGPDFFLANLPLADTTPQALRLVAGYFYQDVFGNPITPSFAWGAGDMSLPPVYAMLVVTAAVLCGRRALGWWTALAAFALLTFCHPAFRFAVAHLGLGLSFSNPMYTALIPLAMLAAHGADAIVAGPSPPSGRRWVAIGLATLLLASTATLAVTLAHAAGETPRWPFLALGASSVIVLALALHFPRAAVPLLAAKLMVSAVAHGRELLLTQPPARIATSSPLVEDLRRLLPPGGRYAVVGPLDRLPPNLNATFGLRSLHTYNSLSSRRYQALVGRLGGTTEILGRHNRSIQPHFGATDLLLSSVAVVLSPVPLREPGLTRLADTTDDIEFYRVDAFRACCLRLPARPAGADGTIALASLAGADWTSIRPRADLGDKVWYDVDPTPRPSLLVTGTAWHPQWHATALDARAHRTGVRVRAVNDAFLGLELPAGTTGVELEFRPAVRFAWISHLFYLVLAACTLAGFAYRRFSRSRTASAGAPP